MLAPRESHPAALNISIDGQWFNGGLAQRSCVWSYRRTIERGCWTRAVLFTLARVLHISMLTAQGGNLTEKEKSHGSQETHQAFEKGKEAQTDQDANKAGTVAQPFFPRRRLH
jgi:hypothetical protein